jgi:hypothetical protein
MSYKIFYQICKYPHELYRNKYLVRKLIYENSNKLIKNENYIYGERNLNKLNKEINKMKYSYESIASNNFENIAFPINK